jgi:hypothetical protein
MQGMPMKIEITEAGVYDRDEREVPPGTVLDIPGDTVPAWLVNKGRVIAAPAPEAEMVASPKKRGR